jgi:triacylglycerol lipase
MFGFGRLGSYDYFAHLDRALSDRLGAAGDQVEIHVAQVSPTESIRRRAVKLAELVASTCDPAARSAGPIHLIGHSTGGLDARLLASPTVSLALGAEALAWRARLASVTTINAPHFGTPLASFFTTASGQRALRALSALTFIALSLGSPPLSAASALVLAFGRVDRALGLDLAVLDRTTDAFLRVLDDARSAEVREYVDAMTRDQGAMVQLMPEAMDLFDAGIEDRPGVLYQSTASMAPHLTPRTVLRALARPWSALSGLIFATLHGISSRYNGSYPCAAVHAGDDNEQTLTRALETSPDERANDGVVPIRSQLWGKLVWAGHGDHLDVLGHFQDTAPAHVRDADASALRHVDWLHSGSQFGRAQFAALVDAIARGLVSSGHALRGG